MSIFLKHTCLFVYLFVHLFVVELVSADWMESAENRVRILSHLLQSQILIKGQQPLPSDQNYTQICRIGSVSELPSGDDVMRKFQSIFLKRVAMEHDEIKFLLLTYKRACCQGSQRAPVECERSAEFQSLCEVARESCIERLLTQVRLRSYI